jgi:DNA-binding IclR family transcriptional regulator
MDSTLAKGLNVLEWLAREQRPCRLGEVAEALGLARSNAHRTLQTLASCGWVRQDPETSSYEASLKLFELGAMARELRDLRGHLRPLLADLAAATGETIHLASLEGAEVIYLDKLDSPRPVAAYSRVGGRAAAHCVATGKALLAALEPDEAGLRKRLSKLHAVTPNTITEWPALLAELERVRQRGYAQNREEWRVGVCGLGAPVFDADGSAVAGIGITVPSIRFGRTQVRQLAERLVDCAAQASRSLGFTAPTARQAR